jgi:hypothetical membrane protein
MLQAHSLLWHYLWLAPDVLQLGLAVFLFRRGLHKFFPFFFAYCLYEALETFTLYGMDILPSVSSEIWWLAFSTGLIIEGLVKIAVIVELIRHLLRSRSKLRRACDQFFAVAGACLALIATVAAAYTTPTNPHWFVSSGLILQQSLYIVNCGLILFVFLFAACFKLSWDRPAFGIALGFGIVACQRLAVWATEAGIKLSDHGVRLDFLSMATYHVCVLIWFYFLLVPRKKITRSAVSLPENNLDIWNQELERLLQR